MEDLTTKQWIEKYPYLKKIAENTIFTTEDDINSMKNGKKILVNGQEVVVEFLKRIVQDNNYYYYANRFLNNEIESFGICYIIGGDTAGTIRYEKSTLLEGIEQLINTGELVLQQEERQRYEKLRNSISFERFLEKINGKNYDIEIDGNKYSILIEKIVSLMQLPDEEFDKLCNNQDITNINGIPKEHFIYASYKFFRDNKALDRFIVPSNIKKRYKDIQSLQKLDLQAINKHLKTEDSKFRVVQLDSELRTAILSGMPEDSTQLEKAVYIYIKMCKLLTYDDEYYAVNQKGPATLKHKDVNYVSTINLTNNRVVCFEFNLIYSKLLDELGIKFRSDYKNMIGEAYGAGHANLEFRSGKFLVRADSVTSILQGDIMRSKLNEPLVGLICINKNHNTQQEFKITVTKMYELLVKQELQSSDFSQVEHIETFEELMSEYAQTTSNIQNISLDEKISILIDKVNSTRMVGIDSLSYVLQLKKILFNELELTNNIGISIIRSNVTVDASRIAMACAIISVNKGGFEQNLEQTVYYYYSPNNKLIPISRVELQSKFNDGLFEYIENDDPRISGIVEVGGIKK